MYNAVLQDGTAGITMGFIGAKTNCRIAQHINFRYPTDDHAVTDYTVCYFSDKNHINYNCT